MTRKKLALVGLEQGEGPWIRASGNELRVCVTELKAGEDLRLEIEGLVWGQHLTSGVNPLSLQAGQLYRFTKRVPEGQRPTKTCVEVIVNGPSSS